MCDRRWNDRVDSVVEGGLKQQRGTGAGGCRNVVEHPEDRDRGGGGDPEGWLGSWVETRESTQEKRSAGDSVPSGCRARGWRDAGGAGPSRGSRVSGRSGEVFLEVEFRLLEHLKYLTGPLDHRLGHTRQAGHPPTWITILSVAPGCTFRRNTSCSPCFPDRDVVVSHPWKDWERGGAVDSGSVPFSSGVDPSSVSS